MKNSWNAVRRAASWRSSPDDLLGLRGSSNLEEEEEGEGEEGRRRALKAWEWTWLPSGPLLLQQSLM
jgi:hypothetical protein